MYGGEIKKTLTNEYQDLFSKANYFILLDNHYAQALITPPIKVALTNQ